MENESIRYSLQGIEIIAKFMEQMPPTGIIQRFKFDIKVETKVQADTNLVIPFVTITIRNEETLQVLALFTIACLFRIEEFEKKILLDPVNKLYNIPPRLESVISPISISTTRGIVFSELKGTYLHKAIVPVVFMKTLPEPKPTERKKVKGRVKK